jgi:hypothetical protein
MALQGYGVPDTGAYDRAASDAQYRFNTDAAQNAYGRFLSQQRGSRTLGDMQTGFQRGLPQQYANFNQRGLSGPGIQSGTMQQAMGNYLGDYAQDYTRTQQDITQGLQQYDLNDMSSQAQLQQALDQIQVQKQQDIANAALGIEALRPFLGGLG